MISSIFCYSGYNTLFQVKSDWFRFSLLSYASFSMPDWREKNNRKAVWFFADFGGSLMTSNLVRCDYKEGMVNGTVVLFVASTFL